MNPSDERGSDYENYRNRSYGCEDMAKRSCGDFVVISGKWLGLNWNLFSKTRGLLGIFVDCDLISQKGKGLTAKSVGIFQRRFFFQWENMVNSVHHLWTVGSAGPRWTVDRASAVAHRSSAEQPLRATAAHRRWCKERGLHREPISGLTKTRAVAWRLG
jgi:hypothetical protein